MPSFPDAQPREVLQILGDRPTAPTWLADDTKRSEVRLATNTDDLAPYIQAAIDSVVASKGGGELFFPAGTYLTTDISVPAGVVLVGDNRTTIFKRHSSLPAQTGLINLAGIGAGVRNISIDGDVTTTTTITGNEGGFDPDGDTLTADTSIWVAPGANDFLIEGCYVTHTGGYAVFVDVRTGSTRGGRIVGNTFENNRPHLWKYDAGDTAYGSWTGGVFIKGICSGASPYAASGIVISGNSFRRQTGNCIWMHSDAFDVKHSDITITGNTGEYVARDFTMVGNVQNISVVGNSVSYVGYIHTTDIDAPAAAYSTSSGIYGVAYDNAGYATGTQSGNSAKNVYGGGMDLDGVRDSVIASNYISCNASFGKGIQTGDSSANGGATNVVIEGNFLEGCLYGAIVLANASDCTVRGNRIEHSNYATQPILLYAGSTVPSGNVVTQNRITYTLGGAYCVIESGSGWGSSHINYVGGNIIDGGHAGEFAPDASSASKAGIPMFADASNAALLAREGTGTASSVKIYITEAGTRNQYFQLQSDNALLNISEGGTAQTGILATGTRTTLGYGDALFTGKVMGDAFFAAYDYAGASTSYQASDANALTNDWALLRFNKTSTKWETSLTTSAGARVWTDLVPAEISGLTAGRVVFAASATTLDDDALFTWNDTDKILQAPRLWVVGNEAAQITTVIRGAAAQSNNLTEWHNSSGHSLAVIGPDGKLTLRDIDSSTGSTVSFYYDGTYTAAVIDKPLLLLSGTATALTVKQDVSTYGGIVSGAIQANSTATNAIEVIGSQGGVVADRLLSRVAYYFTKFATATMTAPTSGYGGLQYKAGKIFWYYDDSGTPQWREVDFGSVGAGVTSITGTANQVNASASTGAVTLSLPQSIHTGAGPTFATLVITSSASNAIGVTGSIAAAGYAASSTNTDAIQATSGGVTARYLIGTRSFTLTGDSAANAGLSSSGQGRLYFDSTSNKFQISQHGGAYQDLLTTVAGTSNQVLVNGGTSALSGALTLTLPQSIHTAATPTFSTLALSSAATNALLLSSGSVTAVGLIATGSAYNSIQATTGGIYIGLGVTTDQALYPKTLASDPNNPASGYGGFSHKSGSTYRYWNGSAWADINMSTAGGGVTQLNTLTGSVTLAGTSNQITLTPSGNTITFSTPQNLHTAATPTFGGLTVRGNTTIGGVASTDYRLFTESGNGTIRAQLFAYDGLGGYVGTNTNHAFFIRTNDGNVCGWATTGAFTQYYAADFDSTLNVDGAVTCGSTVVATGAMQSNSTAYNAIQAVQSSAAGIRTYKFTAEMALYLAKYATATMSAPSSGYGGLAYKAGKIFWYYDDSGTPQWREVDFSTVGGGVTSLTASTGISVSASTGAVTITNTGVTSAVAGTGVTVSAATGAVTFSIGQTIGTSASPSFTAVTTSTFHASDATGTDVSFKNSNNAFYVRGNGDIYCGQDLNVVGAYKMDGSDLINTSRQFVGSGVACQSSGIGGGAFNPWNGSGYDTGQDWTIVLSGATFTINGAGSYTTLVFNGGVIVNAS